MSVFSDAFSELSDACQPDSDPVLTKGGGEAPDPAKELDRILERNKTAGWAEGVEVQYGERRIPTSPNGHVYRAVQGGTTGTAEPSWGTADYSRVVDGGVVWEEDGAFSGSPYNLRRAKYEALDLKVKKAMNENQYLNDARGQASSYLYLNLVRERDKYRSVGVA